MAGEHSVSKAEGNFRTLNSYQLLEEYTVLWTLLWNADFFSYYLQGHHSSSLLAHLKMEVHIVYMQVAQVLNEVNRANPVNSMFGLVRREPVPLPYLLRAPAKQE